MSASTTPPAMPRISTLRGIVLGTIDQYVPDDPERIWQLGDGRSGIDCMIPNPDLLHALLSRPLASHWLRVAAWMPDGNAAHASIPVLVDAQSDTVGKALHQLPAGICPVEGVQAQVLAMVFGIQTPPLRDFIERVLCRRDVYAGYWTMPATLPHHLAIPGGLAANSLEMARDLARRTSLEQHERDLAIATGLLHDIGKVWSRTTDTRPSMDHRLVALSRLGGDLDLLQARWPDGAYAMRLALGRHAFLQPEDAFLASLLARLKVADQRSGEEASRAWKPGRYREPG